MQSGKIAIIGAGAVGTSIAYALILKNIATEIILVDIDIKRCSGEILDLTDTIPFSSCSEIRQGTMAESGQADIIIVVAGARQEPGQSRRDLIHTNRAVLSSIINGMRPINPQAILIVVTNPVDTLALHAQQVSGLPAHQVFGSGTFLDTQRMHTLLAKKLHVDPNAIHAYVIGEHGDSQFVPWSSAQIGGISLRDFPGITQADLDTIEQQTKQKAYDIIACKGSTFFGISACVATMCQSIIFDEHMVLPLSCYHEKEDIYFSVPAVLGRAGIEQILPIELEPNEQKKLAYSIQQIKNN
jgi:L-lactate dehydrogenase